MKLKKVKVKKLFGIFDHEIPVNNESGITIVIGENGLGKTVLLEMIEAFFKGRYFYFNNVTFDEMIFEFDDNIKWHLKKKDGNEKDEMPKLTLRQVNKNKTEYKPIQLNSFQQRDLELISHRISRNFPYLRRVGPRTWEDRRTNEIIHGDELVLRFGDYVPSNVYLETGELPKWYNDRQEKVKVSLIETQRLLSTEDREEKIHKRTVEKYSLELSKTIKSCLTESTELSSKLDRTYPNRLIERLKKTSDITDDDLNRELNNLEKKRELLDAVGLIEIEKESNLLEIENPQNVVRDVLMLYVEDSFKKIQIFDQIARKIEIFCKLP